MDDPLDPLREIEGLLETSRETQEDHLEERTGSRIKKYIKLALPHVGLVFVVCCYAAIGAYIFYRLESPNEDYLKSIGKNTVAEMRSNIISTISRGAKSESNWRNEIEGQLYHFNEKLYKAFKEQYVRYPDVRISQRLIDDHSERKKRHRRARSEKAEKMWTAGSALFFAATTMATIAGRIMCVVFALFGAPLAIITIGDLGKFLSECTIWLYRHMQKLHRRLQRKFFLLRDGKESVEDLEAASSHSSSRSQIDLAEWINEADKTEVPVYIVFSILLLYIAFGGILFSFLEKWTYMDAFYFSFISLTTIGFGDITPNNHDYIVVMLVYLGVGLAVTTMCIDLVGIQYIQKIHYFGRKFKGTDIFQLLKRKRIIERKLATGHADEILQIFQQIQEKPSSIRPEEKSIEIKEDSTADWLIDDILQSSRYSFSIPHQSKAYWENFVSPQPSLSSFEYEFPLPSPDYEGIARAARGSRRLRSCPANAYHPPTSVRPQSLRSMPVGSFCTPPASARDPLLSFPPLSFRISEPFMLSKLAAQCDLLDAYEMEQEDLVTFEPPPSLQQDLEVEPEHPLISPRHPPEVPKLNLAQAQSPPRRMRYRSSLYPIQEKTTVEKAAESPEPVLQRKRKEKEAKKADPLNEFAWLNVSPRAKLMGLVQRDLSSLFSQVRSSFSSSSEESLSVVLVSPRTPIGLACMEEWDSYIRMLEEYNKPYEGRRASSTPLVPSPPLVVPVEISPRVVPLSPPFTSSVFSQHSPSAHIHPLLSRILSPPPPPEPTPPRPATPTITVSPDPTDPGPSEIAESPPPLEDDPSVPLESSSDDEDGGFELDLGAFELVDSGMTAETLLNTEEPVIFHQEMPVHSVHHDTVQTEAALSNLMAAPNSMLTATIPPVMVEDNYCFVVDGESVRMGDILGDDQWWRHTSRPTKYFYSEDLRQFHRVNCITAKGKVITAKLATTGNAIQVQIPSSSSTPRSSVSGGTTRSRSDSAKVPLSHVYKVIRFYSFWKTCTSFHRIVTMIDKVSTEERGANPEFKKRLFVQYLWRNAKAIEKARVQKEFDPRRQRLLRFVTDPAARKRFVEDDSSTFAVIIGEDAPGNASANLPIIKINQDTIIDFERKKNFREDSEESTIDFPVKINATPAKFIDEGSSEAELLFHYGEHCEPIPVYSVDELPLDGPSTLSSTIKCPVKYISKIPPTMVVDNFCFICDGDQVSLDEILSDQQWWKQTSSSTRFYCSENMTTFHQVTLLTCKGELRGAYRSRRKGADEQGIGYDFKKRIFVQYFWRSEKPNDREKVNQEYMEFRAKQYASHRNSLVVPPTNLSSR
ncbi:hypothetical protein WR25_06634 [Diploscapter pachys]|uniref:Potassium channel domain-containing protein n=1 Tax=Diploscapter pachys TaxID=2018661 RepID=A0A2A2J2P5_9BILA|nr:hypothetical protein WR25_06634 [Diploscapter pachys]